MATNEAKNGMIWIAILLLLLLVGGFAAYTMMTDGTSTGSSSSSSSESSDISSESSSSDASATSSSGAAGKISGEQAAKVEAYLRANIASLADESPVLGGTFYVTDIRWNADNTVTIDYEDGHIAFTADVSYRIENDTVVVESFESTPQ